MPPKADEQRPSQLPEAFVDRLRAIIPAERFDAALASFSAVSGVCSEGFSTTVFPQARAGAIFQAAIRSGKFQGMIWPTTPSALGRRPGKAYSSLSAHPAW